MSALKKVEITEPGPTAHAQTSPQGNPAKNTEQAGKGIFGHAAALGM